MTAVTPSLAARWAQRDLVAFRHRVAFGLRGILAIIIPSAVGMVLLRPPAHRPRPGPQRGDVGRGEGPAAALALTTRAAWLLHLPLHGAHLPGHAGRPHRLRLYVVENGTNIVFGLLLVGPLGVRGLALSLSIAYTVAALLAMAVVRQRVGGLGGDDLTTPVKRVLAASAVMAVVTVVVVDLSGAPSGWGLCWSGWWPQWCSVPWRTVPPPPCWPHDRNATGHLPRSPASRSAGGGDAQGRNGRRLPCSSDRRPTRPPRAVPWQARRARSPRCPSATCARWARSLGTMTRLWTRRT